MIQERLSNSGIVAVAPPEDGSLVSKEIRWAFSAASMTISSNRLLDRLNMVDRDDEATLRISMAERLSRGRVNELTRRSGIRRKLSESSIRRHMLAYEEIARVNAKLKGQYESEEDLIRVKAK